MEAIGMISSLLAIVSSAIEAAKILKTLYKAPKELISLVSELEHFNLTIREIQNLHQPNVVASSVIGTTLKRSKELMLELQQLISAKLLDGELGVSKKVRRVAWARNKARIHELKEALRDSRHGLIAALSAVSSSFSFRADTHLSSLDQSMSRIQATTNIIHDTIQLQASATQRMIDQNKQTIEEYNRTTQQVLNQFRSRIPYGSQLHQLTTNFGQPLQLVSSCQSEKICGTPDEEDIFYDANQNNSPIINVLMKLNGSIAQEPATAFDRSSTFYPEQYAQRLHKGLTTRLNVLSMSQYSTTSSSRTDMYNVRFATSPRKWQTVTILLSISRKSTYYRVTQIAKHQLEFRNYTNALPASFEEQIQNLLVELDPSEKHANLSLEVIDSESGPRLEERPAVAREEDEVMKNKAAGLLDFLRDIGCPQFCESEVVQLGHFGPNFTLCQLPTGIICYELPVNLKESKLWDRIKALFVTRGKPSLQQFLGVVSTDGKKYVRGVLMQAANDLVTSRFIEATKLEIKVPWTQREQWARQVVGAVSAVHSTGNIVGTLGTFPSLGLSLDGHDNAFLTGFSRYREPWSNRGGLLPPECRPPNVAPAREDINTRADLFQLGIFLWNLAEQDIAPLWGNPFCRKANCPNAMAACSDSHANPIALPRLEDDIPAYYQEIIDICRAAHPSDRWPASELLSLFPLTAITAVAPPHARNIDCVDILTVKNPTQVWCDLCGHHSTSMRYYHCNLCEYGNFDICAGCVGRGAHCLVEEHFLEEIILDDGELTRTKRYHSRKTAEGEMKETVFQF